ncbi:MAG: sulfotransferase domain-containing protein, partial [Candidatus Aenigmatarchaeota archaeon]
MKNFNVFIVGFQKSGTSSLSYYVGQHPCIRGHKSREMSYFVSDREYKREFSSVFQEYYPDGVDQEQLVLAKSVDVAYVEKAAQRLKEHSPDCKIVMVLRDPVDRAYSAYWHMRREGWETKETFEKALDAEEEHKEEDIAL